jgi:hypothetical protein
MGFLVLVAFVLVVVSVALNGMLACGFYGCGWGGAQQPSFGDLALPAAVEVVVVALVLLPVGAIARFRGWALAGFAAVVWVLVFGTLVAP